MRIEAQGDGQATFKLHFSHKLAALNDAARAAVVSLQTFDGASWKDVLDTSEIADDWLTITSAPGAFAAGTLYHLHVNGAGPSPLIGAAGEALAGWWGDGVPPMGGGRDISIVRSWQPAA